MSLRFDLDPRTSREGTRGPAAGGAAHERDEDALLVFEREVPRGRATLEIAVLPMPADRSRLGRVALDELLQDIRRVRRAGPWPSWQTRTTRARGAALARSVVGPAVHLRVGRDGAFWAGAMIDREPGVVEVNWVSEVVVATLAMARQLVGELHGVERFAVHRVLRSISGARLVTPAGALLGRARAPAGSGAFEQSSVVGAGALDRDREPFVRDLLTGVVGIFGVPSEVSERAWRTVVEHFN